MDPKQLALGHFEKAILGGFAVWTVISLVGLAGAAGGASGEDVGKMREEVLEHMKGSTVGEPTKPTWADDLRTRLAGAPRSEAFPEWVFHRRPLYLYQVEDTTPQYHPKHRPPVNLATDTATRGQIEITWSPSIENEYVVTSFTLQRREGQNGEWKTVAEVGANDATRYTDKDISSLAKYYYRVVSQARIDSDDPVVTKYGLKLEDDQRQTVSDTVGPVGTDREIYIVPVGVDPVTEQELIDQSQEVGTADLKVRRWNSETSKWEEASYWRVKVGDKIGDKKRKFDFSTGAELVDVRVEKRDTGRGYAEEWHFIKVRWPDGAEEETNNRDPIPE